MRDARLFVDQDYALPQIAARIPPVTRRQLSANDGTRALAKIHPTSQNAGTAVPFHARALEPEN